MTKESPMPLSAERVERRMLIAELTTKGNALYDELRANAHARDELIVAEMEEGAVARELAEITGLTVGRIYKLRDAGKSRETKGEK